MNGCSKVAVSTTLPSHSMATLCTQHGVIFLWFPAQIPFLTGANWLNRGKQHRHFKYKDGPEDQGNKTPIQNELSNRALSRPGSYRKIWDFIIIKLLKCKEKRQNPGLSLEKQKMGAGNQRGTPASEWWRQTGSQEGNSWGAQRWGQALPQPSLISKVLRKVFAQSLCFLTTFGWPISSDRRNRKCFFYPPL